MVHSYFFVDPVIENQKRDSSRYILEEHEGQPLSRNAENSDSDINNIIVDILIVAIKFLYHQKMLNGYMFPFTLILC